MYGYSDSFPCNLIRSSVFFSKTLMHTLLGTPSYAHDLVSCSRVPTLHMQSDDSCLVRIDPHQMPRTSSGSLLPPLLLSSWSPDSCAKGPHTQCGSDAARRLPLFAPAAQGAVTGILHVSNHLVDPGVLREMRWLLRMHVSRPWNENSMLSISGMYSIAPFLRRHV
ncbi:hypothetical protein BC826DRAFT_355278 [Russula brevipes]|nr:hypothetical protein BC826DRAFT_355278 [Russula brevipes]